MTQRKKYILTGALGILSLLASAAAFILLQVCFTQSFWTHAVAAPVNPQTIFQPTPLSKMSAICEIAFVVLLCAGIGLLATSAWCLLRHRRAFRQPPNDFAPRSPIETNHGN